MIIKLPNPPGINSTYKIGGKRFYKSKEAVQWQHDAFFLLKQHRSEKRHFKDEVELLLKGPKTYRWDIDRSVKIILDTLVMANFFIDDSMIMRVEILKKYYKGVPELEVTI